MQIELQYPQAAELLMDMLNCMTNDQQDRFRQRVSDVSSQLHHPSSGGAVVLTIGGDCAHEPPITFGSVVAPLERAEVT